MVRKKSILEISVSVMILIVVALTLGYVYRQTYGDTAKTLKAEFDNVGGLMVGSPVKINGVTVGQVRSMDLNPKKNFTVVVAFSVPDDIDLSEDTEAAVVNETLLGNPVLTLTPGSLDEPLAADGVIYRTTPPANFGDLLERFLFSSKNDDSKDGEKGEDGGGEGASVDEPAKAP